VQQQRDRQQEGTLLTKSADRLEMQPWMLVPCVQLMMLPVSHRMSQQLLLQIAENLDDKNGNRKAQM